MAEIHVDDDLIWNKDEHNGEIDLEAITEAFHDRAHAHAWAPPAIDPPFARPMLELYQAEGCGHSANVHETPTDLGISYLIHDPRSAAGETRNE